MEVREMWTKCMKREAVQLLMLHKVNVGIQTLKQEMSEVLAKDSVFEQQLFEVTSQGRDLKNQVTFRLKEEFYPWFDPFFYIAPDHHSQIFRMYE